MLILAFAICRPVSHALQFCKGSNACRLIALLIAISATPQAKASEILHYLPEDALGFVVLQDLSDVSAKTERVAKLFELALPAPLAFAKASTGLGEGIDEKGDLLVALLPGTREQPEPQPMLLLPIDDYEAFASSIYGDPKGEISRVAVAGEEVLVAKMGSFALLMDVEHRETLELMIGLEPQPVPALKPLEPWLTKSDCVAALMPAGLEFLIHRGTQVIDRQQSQIEEHNNGQEAPALLKQLEMNLTVSKWLLETLGDEVSFGAVSVSLDEDLNLVAGKRIVLKEGNVLAELGPVVPGENSPLIGYANQTFVLAGGGPLPENWLDMLAEATKRIMQKISGIYGSEDLGETQWNQLAGSYRRMMEGLQSYSMIMLPGREGEPLFGNIFGVAKAKDSSTYLKSFQEAVKIWNEIMAKSSSDISFQYEVTPRTIADAEACEIVVDVAAAVHLPGQAPNVPIFNWLLEAMFGEDGKMHQILVAADKKTIVYGMADEEQLKPIVKSAKDGAPGLINSSEMQTTIHLLPAKAPWKLFVSPSGCVQWVTRIVNEFLVHLQGETVEIPNFNTCPPVGISLNVIDRRIEFDLVSPVDALRALADFIKKCQTQL